MAQIALAFEHTDYYFPAFLPRDLASDWLSVSTENGSKCIKLCAEMAGERSHRLLCQCCRICGEGIIN